MNLLKVARVPAPTVTPDTTVLQAIQQMCEIRVGAVSVVKHNELVGIFTERDVVRRVCAQGYSLDQTKMSEVMTSPVKVAHPNTNPSEALTIMATNRFRHLPIVSEGMKLEGMLSLSRVLYWINEDLSQELKALDAYVSADGPGG